MTLTAAPSAEIRVAGLTKAYGRTMARADVTFAIRTGEILGVIGPNVVGKTTLFDCLAGNDASRRPSGPRDYDARMSSRVSIASIRRLKPGVADTDQDLVVVEAPLAIVLRSAGGAARYPLGVAMRTPGDDRELVLGLLHGERLIREARDVVSLSLNRAADDVETADVELRADIELDEVARRSRALLGTSACGLCGRLALDRLDALAVRSPGPGPQAPLSWSAGVITQLPPRLRARQTVFGETGGLHAAGWVDEHGALTVVREDVGRHNAVDKLVGASLEAGALPASRLLLVVSGRVAYEIVQKAAVAGAAGIVAVGAPSSLAVEAAAAAGLVLVGFARAGRCNVYTGHDRIRP